MVYEMKLFIIYFIMIRFELIYYDQSETNNFCIQSIPIINDNSHTI